MIGFDYSYCCGMNKRTAQKKLNGEILLMQTELMSKLALANEPKKMTDQLGFPLTPPQNHPDALLDLISKSKNITQKHAKQIEAARKSQSKKSLRIPKEGQGTFLTGTGLSTEPSRLKHPRQVQNIDFESVYQPSDPNDMLKDLIVRRNATDLEELRRLIKETSSNLQGCSRKLNKNKKSILHVADRYTKEMSMKTLNFLQSYEEFESKNLEDEEYMRRY